MRFRPAMMIVGAALIGAVPAFANTIPYAAPVKESFGIQLGGLSEIDFDGHSAYVPRYDKSWNQDAKGNEGSGTDKYRGNSNFLPAFVPAVASVPEPGSLLLLFIGLASTGFMALRRRKLPSKV